MQKVEECGQCPQCGGHANVECWAEDDYICYNCCIIWTQIDSHSDYGRGVHSRQPNFYYVYDIQTMRDAFGQFDFCSPDEDD